MNSSVKVKTYNGFIQAMANPVKGDPVKVVLVLSDGTELPILHRGAAVDMLDHLGADVELEAFLEETPEVEGGSALKVRSYVVTDGYEDSWYDDDD